MINPLRCFVIIFFSLIFFKVPGVWGEHETPAHASENPLDMYRLLNLFGDAFSKVRSEYVTPVDDKKLIEAAISGMVSSLDPHSTFLNEKEFQDLQERMNGEYGGLGIELIKEYGLLKVISPLDDTPAARAGIQPGDYIVEIDGKSLLEMRDEDPVELLKGLPGTEITLKIMREGTEPLLVKLKREIIRIQPVRWQVISDVGVIRIASFVDETTADHFAKAIIAINDATKGKLKGLIIDLRNNVGGLLDQGVSVCDSFLDEKEVVSIRGRANGHTRKYFTRAGRTMAQIPTVVLINNGSASAAEIVAGALQDHKKAILLGTRTFGKGSVQTVMPMGEYGALRLTTDLYYTPSGRSIQAIGIEPDIEVKQSRVESIESGHTWREENIPGAIKSLLSTSQSKPEVNKKESSFIPTPSAGQPQVLKPPPQPTPNSLSETQPESSFLIKDPREDFQLQRALDLILGLSRWSK